MEATAYESLLEKVYGSRPDSKGIDADMYHLMVEEYQNLVTRSMYETQQERILEFKKAFVIIRECVQQAIIDGAKKIMHKANDEVLQSIERMAALLDYDFYDRFELSQIISKCNRIFTQHGLKNSPACMYGQTNSASFHLGKYN